VSIAEFLVEESHALPLVHFQVLIPQGSLLDPEGREGLTRLSARLLRRGTRLRDATAIEEAIDSLGAELSIDTTPSFVRIAGSVIKRSLAPLLALVGELLREPSSRSSSARAWRRCSSSPTTTPGCARRSFGARCSAATPTRAARSARVPASRPSSTRRWWRATGTGSPGKRAS
jgi:hypothetical protein